MVRQRARQHHCCVWQPQEEISVTPADPGLDPIRANLRPIVNPSAVIVRACGRSSNHGKSGFGTTVPQPAVRGLLDAPLEAGHDNPRDRRGKLKLARMGTSPAMTTPIVLHPARA